MSGPKPGNNTGFFCQIPARFLKGYLTTLRHLTADTRTSPPPRPVRAPAAVATGARHPQCSHSSQHLPATTAHFLKYLCICDTHALLSCTVQLKCISSSEVAAPFKTPLHCRSYYILVLTYLPLYDAHETVVPELPTVVLHSSRSRPSESAPKIWVKKYCICL